tara:strand:+ start:274 stop:555 length:282 start_codon:yes stop_codon:yes gene_type:complete
MGYLKYKTTSTIGDFGGLISTENVDDVRQDSGVLEIAYSTGILLQLEDVSGTMVQDDVNAVIKGVNILNGSSGSSLDVELSSPIESVQASTAS